MTTHPTPIDLTLAPDTTLTIESLRTGREFTYRLRRSDPTLPTWTLDYVTGPRNEDAQLRLGHIVGTFYHPDPQADPIADAPHAAFAFYWACPAHPQLRATHWANCQPD